MTQDRLEQLIQHEVHAYAKKQHEDLQLEVLNKQMDMVALQGQINPHFLYNVLECIRGQALLYNVPEIADTTEALSRFFRYSISTNSDIVTIDEEIKNIKNYIKIQQFRFKNRLVLDIVFDKSDQSILTGLIPKLSLQPIVENAIIHGFAHKTSDNQITIEIIRTKKHINILISDNGCGMSPIDLEKLKQKIYESDQMEQQTNSSNNGIALFNVNRRLQLFYGDEYGLTVNSIERLGTEFEIHIPIKQSINKERNYDA